MDEDGLKRNSSFKALNPKIRKNIQPKVNILDNIFPIPKICEKKRINSGSTIALRKSSYYTLTKKWGYIANSYTGYVWKKLGYVFQCKSHNPL